MADKVLVLGFNSETSEGKISFTVNRPATAVGAEHIKAAMETMIAQNALGATVTTASGGREFELIGSIASAKFVTTADTSYDFE